MRLFILLLMQVFVFMPRTSLAADSVRTPVTQDKDKVEVTEAQKANIHNTYGKLPLYFIENKGPVDGQVSFYERGAGHATFFTEDGVVLSLTKKESKSEKASFTEDILGLKTEESAKHTTEAVTLSFVGANKKVRISACEQMTGKVNYFIGNDRSKWRTNIPTYGAVTYHDIYKNIDVKFYGNNKNMEHDVIVRPGGDPSLVRFAYEGIKGLKVTESGDIEVILNNGKIVEQKPVIYQEIAGERLPVDGSYRILKGGDGAFIYGFTVASYDRTKNLVIDPVLVYSTYLGGAQNDQGDAIAVDASGNAYITGMTESIAFPVASPIQGSNAGFSDVFVTKINSAGSAMVYSTYLGGSGDYDQGNGIAVDASGNAYVSGTTASADFPLMNPIQGAIANFIDTFVTKINPAGSALVYSTYLGGAENDWSGVIAVDASGNAYVTGWTFSPDFPLMNPIQGVKAGGAFTGDTFVTKINPFGTALVYSTYLGGALSDVGVDIAVDSAGAAYVTGHTYSTDFPLINPIQGTYGGDGGGFFGGDAFVTKINSAGTAFVYSTYLGGSGGDQGNGIAVDATGNAYVIGQTESTNFPLFNPMQGTFGGGAFGGDAFVSKIPPVGSVLAYSTYLGGASDDLGYGITVDTSGFAYVTGMTSSLDFPLVAPIQGTFGGGGSGDVFVTKINSSGAALIYSTYLGGADNESGVDVAIDASGNAYVTGWTASPDFPLMNPIQSTYGGGFHGGDAFVTKISGTPPPAVTLAITPDAVSIARGSTLGYTVTATNNTAVQQCIDYWETVTLPDGSTYPAIGALFGPLNVCLNGNEVKNVHLTHGVPMSAPVGTYVFNAFVGTNPTPVTSEAHFNFDVTAFSPATKHPQRSWRLLENGFRK